MAVLVSKRRVHEDEEETVFVSMTDLMISILFIVMILMAFFAKSSSEEEVVTRWYHDTQVEVRDTRIAELEQLLEVKDMRLRALEAQLLSLLEIRKELEQKIRELEVSNETLENQLEEQEYIIARKEDEISDLEEEIIRLRAELERLLEMTDLKLAAALENISQTRRAVLSNIQNRLTAAGINVQVDSVSGVIRFDENVLRFQSGSYDPSKEVEITMRQVANILLEELRCFTLGPGSNINYACNPHLAVIEAIQIEGHTDAQRMRPRENMLDNLDLSAKRAASTFRIFLNESPELALFQNANYALENDRLQRGSYGQPVLSVSGYGSTRPVSRGGDIAADRRIDLRFIMTTPKSVTEAETLFDVVESAIERVQ